MTRVKTLYFLLAAAAIGCSSDDRVHTLYRNSALDGNARIHVASFDASEKEEYNRAGSGSVLARSDHRNALIRRDNVAKKAAFEGLAKVSGARLDKFRRG